MKVSVIASSNLVLSYDVKLVSGTIPHANLIIHFYGDVDGSSALC